MKVQNRIILFSFLILSGCTGELTKCPIRLKDMKLFSVVNFKTNKTSEVKGWYHSEFQKDKINFTVEFSHYGAGEGCEYYWANYPDINSFKIRCNKDVIGETDTIQKGDVLNKMFSITTNESNFFLSFLINQIDVSKYKFNEQYYTFSLEFETSEKEIMVDSCIIKRY